MLQRPTLAGATDWAPSLEVLHCSRPCAPTRSTRWKWRPWPHPVFHSSMCKLYIVSQSGIIGGAVWVSVSSTSVCDVVPGTAFLSPGTGSLEPSWQMTHMVYQLRGHSRLNSTIRCIPVESPISKTFFLHDFSHYIDWTRSRCRGWFCLTALNI